jgi:hypothetical protein
MRAKKVFCILAAVSLLGHGASLLLSGDAPAAQEGSAAKSAPSHLRLLCPLV